MRQLSYILGLILAVQTVFGQNIPNGDFETWTVYNHYQLDNYYAPYRNVYRSFDHYEGKYALRLENTVSEDGSTKYRGYCYNVISSIGQSGFPFEGDVLSVVFYAKYDLAEGDSARIYVVFRENGGTKGYVNFYTTGNSNGGYIKFSIPIFWYNTRTPDEVSVYLYSNEDADVQGNGYIIIDDLHFENIGERGQDIINFGFEDWTNIGVSFPQHWRSLDLRVFDDSRYFLPDTGVEYSTDAYRGSYSMKVGNYVSGGIPRSSYVFLGTENDDYYTPAFKLYNRYKYIQGYYKYYTDQSDSGRLYLRTYKNGTQLSFSNIYFQPKDEWSYFNIPINYYNDSIPDSAAIMVYSAAGTPTGENSHLLLDELDLVMEPWSLAVNELTADLGASPNPCRDKVHLVVPDAGILSINNSFGQNIKSFPVIKGKIWIDVKELPSGLYYLNIKNTENLWQTKILKL